MTAPFASDTPDLIKRSHRQVCRASLSSADMDGALPLDLVGLRFWFDENRAPRAGATIETASPLSLLTVDPRKNVRLNIEAGYIRPGGEEDADILLDLGLRKTTRSEESGNFTLEASGDEALCLDAAPVVSESISSTSHSAAMRAIVYKCINPRPRFALPAGALGGSVTVDAMTDRWGTIEDIADRIQADIYDNGLRQWVIEPRPELVSTPAHSLVVGEEGTVLRADTSISRDDWFNHVSLIYEWRDSADVDHVLHSTAYVDSGPYSPAIAGKRSLVERRYMMTTQAEADTAAKTLLARAMSRSVSYSLDAIAAYWLRPGMTVSVTLPGESAALHLVSSVSFEPMQGTMSLTTRLPVTITASNGTTAEPEPPAPPPTQTFVSTWTCNNSESYEHDGDARTYDNSLVQGYYPNPGSGGGIGGNSSGIALFTGSNSTGDESSTSITAALSGASLDKVEVYLYADHWYYSDGGTAQIGYYKGTSLPATFTGAKPYVTVKGWPRKAGKWVNITSKALKADLLSGAARGVTVGPGPSNSYRYYGYFNGHTQSKPPKLRLTYTKAAT